jgi:hypothetical protein
MTYRIYAISKQDGRREKVDEATSRQNAIYLTGEYALAFHHSHTVECKPDPYAEPKPRRQPSRPMW